MTEETKSLILNNEDIHKYLSTSAESADNILANTPIKDLVKLESDISHDINLLDSCMKTMVYENYNKLLQTSEIMQNMNLQFNEINSKMSQLDSCLTECFSKNKCLLDELKPSQESFLKHRRENTVYFTIEKLHKLPDTLNNYLDKEDFDGLINCYISTKNVLHRHDTHASINSIKRCAFQIIEQTQNAIQAKLLLKNREVKFVECHLNHLLVLGYPETSVADLLIKILTKYLANDLIELQNKTHVFVEWRHFDDILLYLSSFLSTFQKYFTVPSVNPIDDSLAQNMGLLVKEMNVFVTNRKIDCDTFNASVSSIKSLYLKLNSINGVLDHMLQPIIVGFSNCFKAELVNKMLSSSIEKCVDILKHFEDIFIKLFHPNDSTSSPIDVELIQSNRSECCTELISLIEKYVSMFSILYSKETNEDPFLCLFDSDYFQSNIKMSMTVDFFHGLHNHVIFLCASHLITVPCSQWLLQLYMIISHLSSANIPLFVFKIYELFSGAKSGGYAETHDSQQAELKRTLTDQLKSCSCTILSCYVSRYCELNIIPLFQQSLTNPEGNINIMEDVALRLESMQKFMTIVTQISLNKSISKGPVKFEFTGDVLENDRAHSSSYRHIADLGTPPDFKIHHKTNLKLNELMSLMYEILVKTIIEIVRLNIYDQNALQRLQINLFQTKKLIPVYSQHEKENSYLERQLLHAISNSSNSGAPSIKLLTFEVTPVYL